MIILYKGARGMSKTLTMVKDGLKYKKNGWRVLTNLEDSPFETITSEFVLSLSSSSTLYNTALLIDEIELFFDSRDWNRRQSRDFGRFLQQIRKRNVPILCTAQFTDLIEKRLRQQIDMAVQCSYNKRTCISSCVYIDLTFTESTGVPSTFQVTYYAPPIFSLYNTNQIINVNHSS